MSTPAEGTARPHAAAELAVDVDVASVVDANDLRDDTGNADGLPDERTELPLEADAADVVEQGFAVPYDDERR